MSCLRVIVGLLWLFAQPALGAEALRVGVATDRPPLSWQEDGRLVGLEVDNARAVAEILGRPLSLVPLDSGQLRDSLLAGQVDVLMAGLVPEYPDNAGLLFTRPWGEGGQMAILRVDGVARFGQPWAVYAPDTRVGVEAGSRGEAFAREELSEGQVATFSSESRALAALRKGSIDLFVDDAATSWRLATLRDSDDLVSLYRPLVEESYAWAVRPNAADLAQALERALRQMEANGTLAYILDRWIPVQVDSAAP